MASSRTKVCVLFRDRPSPGNRRQVITMSDSKADEMRTIVRDHYGAVARGAASGCGPAPEGATSGCGPGCCAAVSAAGGTSAGKLGYTADDTGAVPEGADLGLGCGNPTAIAALEPGQTVLDLGAGGGFDCFLAARQVGPTGTVIGVDMTPDMVTL